MSDHNYNLTGTKPLTNASNVPQWTKYTVTYAQLAAVAFTNNVTLFSLPAKSIVTNVIVKHSTPFTGGLITAYTISVGIGTNPVKFAAAFNVFQAASDTAKLVTLATSPDVESFVSATNIIATAVSLTDTLNNAVAGSVDIWVQTSSFGP